MASNESSRGSAADTRLPRPLYVLFSVVLMDMVGFGFVIPLLPDYAGQFGATPALIGLLTATYSFGQFLISPIVGKLSDRYGRKPLLLVSVAGSVAALVLLGSAWSLTVVFAARLLDGLTGGNLTVAQSYIADSTDSAGRARALGMIGAAFGLGFILGPLFGGILVRYGFAVPAYTAAGIALANFVLVATVLPESLPRRAREADAAEADAATSGHPGSSRRSRRMFPLERLRRALSMPAVAPVLVIILVYGLAFTLFELTFSLFAREALGMSPDHRSFLLAYIGVIVAVVQGLLVGPVTRRFGERRLIVACAALLAVVFAFWAFSSSVLYLAIVLLPLSVGAGLMQPVLRSVLSQSVPQEETGGILGVSASADSLNRVIGPSLGGLLIGQVGTWAPGILGSLLLVAVTLLARRVFRGSFRRTG
jgi:DHA1 family tetracycline resistance protein-like MFS transporter